MIERIKVCFGAGMKLVGQVVCHRVIYGVMAAVHGAGMAGVVPHDLTDMAVCGLYALLCLRG